GRGACVGGDQVVVDLPGAQDDARDLVATVGGLRVVEYGVERAGGQLVERRDRARVAQQALGREDDERLPVLPQRLEPQQVEVLRGRRAVGDRHRPFAGELEVALDARARVLRALTLVPVRQE